MAEQTTVATQVRTSNVTTEEQVLGIVRGVLGRPTIDLDDDLFDHGGTSLSFVRVLAQIKQELGVMIHAASLGGITTPRNLASKVTAHQTQGA